MFAFNGQKIFTATFEPFAFQFFVQFSRSLLFTVSRGGHRLHDCTRRRAKNEIFTPDRCLWNEIEPSSSTWVNEACRAQSVIHAVCSLSNVLQLDQYLRNNNYYAQCAPRRGEQEILTQWHCPPAAPTDRLGRRQQQIRRWTQLFIHPSLAAPDETKTRASAIKTRFLPRTSQFDGASVAKHGLCFDAFVYSSAAFCAEFIFCCKDKSS